MSLNGRRPTGRPRLDPEGRETHPHTFTLHPDVADMLRDYSVWSGRSISAIVRDAVDVYLPNARPGKVPYEPDRTEGFTVRLLPRTRVELLATAGRYSASAHTARAVRLYLDDEGGPGDADLAALDAAFDAVHTPDDPYADIL